MNETRLRNRVSTGKRALIAECLTISLAFAIIVGVFLLSPTEMGTIILGVHLLALAAGTLGAFAGGNHHTGLVKDFRYAFLYGGPIAVMISADMLVRFVLGGDIPLVLANWAALIGSASALNLFLTKIPFLNMRRWMSESDLSGFHPFAMFMAILIQVAQLWITVFGAAWTVVAIQLLVRRLLILPITHLIARLNYGTQAAHRLRHRITLEYATHRRIANRYGKVIEPDPYEQCAAGNLLLKLPIIGGEAMTAGRHSLVRVVDKLIFLEQMLAFASPTVIVHRRVALGHLAFLQTLLRHEGEAAV